jgi:hypothetical protein
MTPPLVLGVEIYRALGVVKKKITKNGDTTHFQILVFPGKNFLSIMAGTNLEHKS